MNEKGMLKIIISRFALFIKLEGLYYDTLLNQIVFAYIATCITRCKYSIMYRHRQCVSVQNKTKQSKANTKQENLMQNYLAAYTAKLLVKQSISCQHLLDFELQDSFENFA